MDELREAQSLATVEQGQGVGESPERSREEALTPEELLSRLLVHGPILSQGLAVAAELRLADLLAAGPRHADELARETGTHADSLYRMMRMLASAGVFAEVGERCFTLTRLASCLRADAPRSLWA